MGTEVGSGSGTPRKREIHKVAQRRCSTPVRKTKATELEVPSAKAGGIFYCWATLYGMLFLTSESTVVLFGGVSNSTRAMSPKVIPP